MNRIMWRYIPVIGLLVSTLICNGQANVAFTGQVIDVTTKQPLINASVGIIKKPFVTRSDEQGKFGLLLPLNIYADTLTISYVGYKTFKRRFSEVKIADGLFELEEIFTWLDEITIIEATMKRPETKKLESSFRLVRENLYAAHTEVTNGEYNQFLDHLVNTNQLNLYERYKPDFSQYDGSLLTFFKVYHARQNKVRDIIHNEFDEYPIVNISHDAAQAYCEWLTDSYNNSKAKKKFHSVRFRLPTRKEWQIAALGYFKFQSWDIKQNSVESGIPEIPGEEVMLRRIKISVKDDSVLYPWYGVYAYRNKAQNIKNCWLGNFKVPDGTPSCYVFRTGGDGFPITGKVASYFPNNIGLYDVCGNAAEMIDEKGVAYGGSWAASPKESTLFSVENYSGRSGSIGFRIFMEVMPEESIKK